MSQDFRTGGLKRLWQMLLATSETAIRLQYNAPWETDATAERRLSVSLPRARPAPLDSYPAE